MAQLLGVFEQPHDVAGAVKRLRNRGFSGIESAP